MFKPKDNHHADLVIDVHDGETNYLLSQRFELPFVPFVGLQIETFQGITPAAQEITWMRGGYFEMRCKIGIAGEPLNQRLRAYLEKFGFQCQG